MDLAQHPIKTGRRRNLSQGVEPNAHIMEAAMNQVESSGPQQETQSRRDSIKDSRVWNAKRDQIC